MARRALICGTLLLAALGCSEKPPTGTTQDALHAVRAGNYDQAIAAASTALKADPKDAEAYLARGRAYHFRNHTGDRHLAIADFTQAITLAPDSPDAYYSRALVYRDEGEKDLADTDEEAARAADVQRRELYKQLPEPPTEALTRPPVEAPKPEKALAKDKDKPPAPKSEAEERKEFKRLQDRFEPAETPTVTQELRRPQDRLREQMARDKAAQLERGSAAEEPGFQSSAENTTAAPITPLDTPPQPSAGRSANGRATAAQTPGGPVARPTPASPFQPRSLQPGMTSQIPGGQLPSSYNEAFPTSRSPFGGQNSYSPFPQKRAGPTGYVEPPKQNPFGRQSRQTYNNPYSRPATTPSNSSDFIP